MATPTWDAPQNGGTANTNPNHINQFLGTHVVTELFEGTNFTTATDVAGELNVDTTTTPWTVKNTVSLAQKVYATSFTTQAGQTAVERVMIPLTQVGNGSDVTVSLYTNNSGAPGTQVGSSVTIPREWCVAKSSDQFPSYAVAFTGREIDTQSSLPAALFRFGGAWNGSAVAIFGGGLSTNQTGAALTSVYVGKPSGINSALQWQTAASLPAAVEWHGYTYVAGSPGYIVYSGGGNNGSGTATLNNNVYVATFAADGTVGAFTQQTATLPSTLWQHGMASYTTPSGTTYLYVIGGATTASGSGTTTVYVNTLSQYGATGASWTATAPLPAALQKLSASVAVINGYVVVAGGGTANLYYAKINSNGNLSPWRTGPTMAMALTDVSVATWGDSLIMIGGANNSLQVQQSQGVSVLSGSGVWSRAVRYDSFINNTVAGNFTFTTPSFLGGSMFDTYSINTNQNVGTDAHFAGGLVANLVSVPLKVTGLTASTTYWVTIGCSGGDAINYTQALSAIFVSGGNAPGANFTSQNGVHTAWPIGGGWTSDGNVGVPIDVYGPTTTPARLLHIVEDSGAKLDWVLTDATTRMSGYTSAVGNTRSFVAFTYDVNGQIIAAVPII